MIYEFRTYDLEPRSVEQFGENTKAKLDGRLKLSPLGGFWYTEMGPLNQVVHIWPYEDANHRSDIRSKAVTEGDWPPDNNDIILCFAGITCSVIVFPGFSRYFLYICYHFWCRIWWRNRRISNFK